ncbi:putative immunoglobulin-like, galactose oxidase-like, Early set domain-containing protein [Helianthus annuus]|uniref:Immunoglobulin-like, galactose oxidase-like, Early set domain-containing protein n=1 Tax=Helianthus annuus TaxID=4232 RepID=A0A251TU70_HELAN|nr:putative immunoglobulin-like, galactose oxidase-like, Early set domain-containing protein [Helianthus annuus]KAJ0533904.1 putative immunoglobulin-like, galactose oxidase-like, Early set domain-containing protein [Helianthus annuus]KAJ0707132.1 putative immunoglobulin-like, galactose oxidase-like, Early set domain-containing protein [Helianthus annuus]KAJ0711153.1 putative immunoglobulin-like, galactose oxidase-like, Early set domain-containing protein [Helianthus annuus]
MVAPSFNTHSFSMNLRLLVLDGGNTRSVGKLTYEVNMTAPPSGHIVPPGYYMLFVVHEDIPSEAFGLSYEQRWNRV